MFFRHQILPGLAAAILTAGCAGSLVKTADSTADATTNARTTAPDPESVQALERKAEAHAQRIAPRRESRPGDPRHAAVPPPPVQPSEVDWMEPQEFRLTPDPNPYAYTDRRPKPTDPPATPPRNPEPAPAPPTAPPVEAPVAVAPPEQPAPVANTPPPAPDAQANGSLAVPAAHEDQAVPAASSSSSNSPTEEDLRTRLARHIKDYPRDVAGHLDYQLALFLHDESVPDLAAIASLPTEDREVITTVMDGLSNFRSTVRSDHNLMLSKKIRPLIDMADRLRSQADLTIPTLVLCTKVEKFGTYVPLEPARFIAGRVNQTIIYCEVENFAAALNNDRLWETRLTQQAVLYDDTGLPVWDLKPQTITDTSRNRRRDFFVATLIKLPANLAVGRYSLKVTIIDQQASRIAESTVPIHLVAQ